MNRMKKNLIYYLLCLLLLENILMYQYQSLDFILRLDFVILWLVSLFFTTLFFYRQSVFSKLTNINLKNKFVLLKKEILNLKVSNTTLILSILNFIIFLVLAKYNFVRLSLVFIFFSGFVIIKKLEFVKELMKKSNADYLKIKELYKNNYKFIYYFNMITKLIFVIYVWYFCVWVIFLQPILFLNEIALSEQILDAHILKNIYHLYYLLILFINSVALDFAIESFLLYSNYELFLQFSFGSFFRRGTRVVSFTLGGMASAGVGIAYSPAVDIYGVNEFQIYFGRGYGYKTSLDWSKGMVMQSYLPKEVLNELVEKYGGEDKIVDGNFFVKVMSENNVVTKTLKKNCTPMEQRLLGLRKF